MMSLYPRFNEWSIYENGVGGWFGWNAVEQRRVELSVRGNYAEAWRALEQLHADGTLRIGMNKGVPKGKVPR